MMPRPPSAHSNSTSEIRSMQDIASVFEKLNLRMRSLSSSPSLSSRFAIFLPSLSARDCRWSKAPVISFALDGLWCGTAMSGCAALGGGAAVTGGGSRGGGLAVNGENQGKFGGNAGATQRGGFRRTCRLGLGSAAHGMLRPVLRWSSLVA